MEQQQIIEGNKLIGEFMGGVSHENETSFIKGYIKENELNFQEKDYPENPHDGSCWSFDELKYHSSWDWLMPVVEKIDSLEIVYHWELNPTTFSIFSDITFEHIGIGFEKIYITILEFITWYNKQNYEK